MEIKLFKKKVNRLKLDGERIYMRFFEEQDVHELVHFQNENRTFFQDFSPKRETFFYTVPGQLQLIQESNDKRKKDEFYFFGIFHNETDELIGTISLFDIIRGACQSCFIGYYMDRKHNGKGYMTEAVKLIVDYAFGQLSIHRIEAGVMPHNIGSIRVLEKAGFEKEGIARKNVKINGEWQDHQVLAIINDGA